MTILEDIYIYIMVFIICGRNVKYICMYEFNINGNR